MEEKEEVKRKLIRHIILNVVGFAVIFVLFGVFVFGMVKSITYRRINKELLEGKEKILEYKLDISSIFEKRELEVIKKDDFLRDFINDEEDKKISRRIVNPNVTVIIRDIDSKEILNEGTLGRLNDYENEISFNSKNFIYDEEDVSESKYVQLLINVDSEKELINSYFEIISLAVCFGIILSVIASYVLSKRTLKPLQENLMKQTEFVQNVSHELRTPLTIIQAKQELLLQEPNAKIIDKVEDITVTLNETNRLTKLIKDLMILSRADGNKMSLQKENVNVDDYIKEVISPYKDLAEMQNKKIIMNLNYGSDIEIDTSKFYQLVVILFDNAMKYTEENDSIEISTCMKENKFVMDIKDTGIGVSSEGLKRIFERFYREDKARNRETGGSGLGLSIASLIVSAHGGTIKASHNIPKGTIFTIKLPK